MPAWGQKPYEGDPNNPSAATYRDPSGSGRTYAETGNEFPMWEALNDDQSTTARDFALGRDPQLAEQLANRANADGTAAQQVNAPKINGLYDRGGRNFQTGLGAYYRAQMNGTGPSVAGIQAQSGVSKAMSGLASAGGGNPGNIMGAFRNANSSATGLANAAASERMNEYNTNATGYGSLLKNQRGADINLASKQGDLDLAQREQNDKLSNMYHDRAQQIRQLDQQNRTARAGAIMNVDAIGKQVWREKQARGKEIQKEQMNTTLGGVQTVGTAGKLFSDKRAKENVKPGDSVRKTMDSLRSYDFNYRGQAIPRGGIMAQDLEKTPLGKSLVSDVGGTKAVDVPQATGLALAGMADLNDRLKKLEAGGG